MPVMNQVATLVALALIALIGLDMVIRRPAQRVGEREPLPEGVDPTTLRRRTPRAQILSGAVLFSAAAVIFAAVWPVL
jgi:hypothetical protein